MSLTATRYSRDDNSDNVGRRLDEVYGRGCSMSLKDALEMIIVIMLDERGDGRPTGVSIISIGGYGEDNDRNEKIISLSLP